MKTPDGPLFRGLTEAPELRAASEGGDSTVMEGHFAIFDEWTEIHSWYEGDFLERLSPGAFVKTIKENRSAMVSQFDHGYDMNIGDAPLGPIADLREDDEGVFYSVPLLDTDYNRDRVLPLLQGRTMDGTMHGSLLGASFRFRAIKDEWNDEPGRSDANPDGLPERTIKEVRLYEFGPVVFPAYAGATAGVRSMRGLTDHYLDRRKEARSKHLAPDPAATGTGEGATTEPPSRHSEGMRAHRPVQLVSTSLHIARGRLRPMEPS